MVLSLNSFCLIYLRKEDMLYCMNILESYAIVKRKYSSIWKTVYKKTLQRSKTLPKVHSKETFCLKAGNKWTLCWMLDDGTTLGNLSLSGLKNLVTQYC